MIDELRGILSGFERPWAVAGGWALDLWLGRTTRAHEDVEIAIARSDQRALLRALSGWELSKVVDGELVPWRGEELALPVHELHARRGEEALEVLLDEIDGERWRFRRKLSVTHERCFEKTAAGWCVLAPEIVLLYKAKDTRPKDRADFDVVVPELGPGRRRWLRGALAEWGGGSEWIARLER